MSDIELSVKLDAWIDDNTVDGDFIAHPDFVYDKLLELETKIRKLQAENAELRKQVNIVARSILAEIGAEFEDDKRIAKKSMPFVRAIVLNKIQDFPPTPPKGE